MTRSINAYSYTLPEDYQGKEEVEEFELLCSLLKDATRSYSAWSIAYAAREFLWELKDPSLSLAYIKEAKPILENIKRNLEQGLEVNDLTIRTNIQKLKEITEKIKNTHYQPTFKFERLKSSNWLDVSKNMIQSLGKLIPPFQSTSPQNHGNASSVVSKKRVYSTLEECAKNFDRDLELTTCQGDTLRSFMRNLNRLHTEKEKTEFINFASRLVKGRVINTYAAIPANIFRISHVVFDNMYQIGTATLALHCLFRFKRIPKDMTPDWVKKVGAVFNKWNQDLHLWDQELQAIYYTDPGVAHDAVLGTIQSATMGGLGVAVKFSSKGIKMMMPATLEADATQTVSVTYPFTKAQTNNFLKSVYPNTQRMKTLRDELQHLVNVKQVSPKTQLPSGFAQHFNKFRNVCEGHKFSFTKLGEQGKGSIDSVLPYQIVEKDILIVIHDKANMPPIKAMYNLNRHKTTITKNLYPDQKAHAFIQSAAEFAQSNKIERIFIAWNPQNLPLASAINTELYTIESIGEYFMGIGNTPKALIEITVKK